MPTNENQPNRRLAPEKASRLTKARLDRVRRVGELHLQGHSIRAIAEMCSQSHAQIHRDLQHARKAWLGSFKAHAEQMLAKENARLDVLASEAWAAWRRSQRDQSEKTFVREDGTITRRTKRVAQSVGDPRFLGIILECSKSKLKLLEVARASEAGNGDDVLVEAIEVVVRSREEAQKMLTFEAFRRMTGVDDSKDKGETE
ncbi:MAG: hypothetical protein ACK56W_24840 [Pirellula sp.]|jgi:hypothetical protein|nr:hypothetical protein [Pirellula sp.]